MLDGYFAGDSLRTGGILFKGKGWKTVTMVTLTSSEMI
jgi:hypothetical protein